VSVSFTPFEALSKNEMTVVVSFSLTYRASCWEEKLKPWQSKSLVELGPVPGHESLQMML